MNKRKPTGYPRLVQRKSGPVWHAALRMPDGSQPTPKIGPAWLKRSSPPPGYLTRALAERRVAEIIEERSGAPREGVPTFEQAVREWLRYVEHDRGWRVSTVRDYRKVASSR